MSLASRIRRMFSGRPASAKTEVREMEDLSGGAPVPGLAASAGAEAAEAQIEAQEAPPEPGP
jgi:hypothetical protein